MDDWLQPGLIDINELNPLVASLTDDAFSNTFRMLSIDASQMEPKRLLSLLMNSLIAQSAEKGVVELERDKLKAEIKKQTEELIRFQSLYNKHKTLSEQQQKRGDGLYNENCRLKQRIELLESESRSERQRIDKLRKDHAELMNTNAVHYKNYQKTCIELETEKNKNKDLEVRKRTHTKYINVGQELDVINYKLDCLLSSSSKQSDTQ